MIVIYVLLAILAFGFLVFVHELGHFLTAKLTGVRVNEFALGMGPAIFKYKRGETTYALRILPIGGFCAMEGEDSESEDPRSFGSKKIPARILIVIAGSLMNLLTGFVVLSILLAPVERWASPTLNFVEPSLTETAGENGLRAGDTILRIDDYRVRLFNDISIGIGQGNNAPYYRVEVKRDGKRITLPLVRLAQQSYVKEGKTVEGYGLGFDVIESSFGAKIQYIAETGYSLVRLVKLGLVELLSGGATMDDVSGPLGIGKLMVDSAKTSMSSLWLLLAFISINLGIMNLLPIPALDGGRLLFLLVELVRRKPINPKYEGYVHGAGLVLLMGFMLFVTYHDIVRVFFS